jgi:hypothetical protein
LRDREVTVEKPRIFHPDRQQPSRACIGAACVLLSGRFAVPSTGCVSPRHFLSGSQERKFVKKIENLAGKIIIAIILIFLAFLALHNRSQEQSDYMKELDQQDRQAAPP